MLVQPNLINAAKAVISSSLAANGVSNWIVYGMYDTTPQQGIQFPCVRVQCFDEVAMYAFNKIGWHQATLELITTAIRITGSNAGEGTSATEFETVSDLVFNPFLTQGAESTLANTGFNLQIQNVEEAGLETTPLTDGWIATQKLNVICARTA